MLKFKTVATRIRSNIVSLQTLITHDDRKIR